MKLGSHTAMVTTARPRISAVRPILSWRLVAARLSAIWASAAAPNTAKVARPASACERSPSVPAMKPGARDVKSPSSAKAATVANTAARNAGRSAAGTETRCGW